MQEETVAENDDMIQSSSMISKVYQTRKQVFLQSLQRILLKISDDRIVRQMLQDRTSGKFIAKRLQEIVQQVIYDDREVFIDVLVQKLGQYESLYSESQTNKVKELGNKILAISDEQNAGEVQNMRRMQSLVEQVQALQAELIAVREANADRNVDIADIEATPKTRLLDPDYNPSSPTFMHIFGTVDLTDLQVKLKLIETDAATSKKLVHLFITKIQKVFSVMKTKTKQFARTYAKKVAEVDRKSKKETSKAAEVKRHYEEEVIPQILEKHKDSLEKHKRLNQERMNEIEVMRALLQEKEEEIKAMKMKQRKLQSENETLNRHVADSEEKIAEMSKEIQKQKETIQSGINKLQEQNSELREVQEEKLRHIETQKQLTMNMETLRNNLDDATRQIESLETELEQAKIVIPRTEKALQVANKEVDDLKHVNNQLNEAATASKRQISDLQRNVTKVQSQLEAAQQELKETKQSLDHEIDENAERKRNIDSLKRDIETHKQTIAKLQNEQASLKTTTAKKNDIINDLEEERGRMQSVISDLESQVKRVSDENQRLSRQVKDQTTANNKQKIQVDSAKEENEKLKETLRQATKKCTNMEGDLKVLQRQLENAKSEVEELTHTKDSNEQQMSLLKEEKEEMKRKLRELSANMRDTQAQDRDTIQEAKRENKQLKRENQEMTSRIAELESSVKTLKKQKQEKDAAIADRERAISELTQDKASLTSKQEKLSEKSKKDQTQINALTKENKEFRRVFDDLQGIAPSDVKEPGDLPAYLRDLIKDREQKQSMLSNLGVARTDDVHDVIDSMRQKADTIAAIGRVLGESSADALPGRIEELRESYEKVKAEHKKIMSMLGDGSGDMANRINELISKHAQLDEQLKTAGEFLRDVLEKVCGPLNSSIKLSFPLRQAVRDKLLALVSEIKSKCNEDHEQIHRVLQKAMSMGYDGNDCVEACSYIATRLSDVEKQKTLEVVNKEMNDVNVALEREKALHSKDIQSLKKRNKELRAAIAQQQGNSTKREEELSDQIQELERKVRELTDALSTERRVREELGRIGAGYSADSKYLRSKLSANELRLITFVQKFMQKEKETQEVHEKQKRNREAFFGEQSSRSDPE